MTKIHLHDVQFQGQLAVEFATRGNSGPNGWGKKVSKAVRESLVYEQAKTAAHLGMVYLRCYHNREATLTTSIDDRNWHREQVSQ